MNRTIILNQERVPHPCICLGHQRRRVQRTRPNVTLNTRHSGHHFVSAIVRIGVTLTLLARYNFTIQYTTLKQMIIASRGPRTNQRHRRLISQNGRLPHVTTKGITAHNTSIKRRRHITSRGRITISRVDRINQHITKSIRHNNFRIASTGQLIQHRRVIRLKAISTGFQFRVRRNFRRILGLTSQLTGHGLTTRLTARVEHNKRIVNININFRRPLRLRLIFTRRYSRAVDLGHNTTPNNKIMVRRQIGSYTLPTDLFMSRMAMNQKNKIRRNFGLHKR